MAVVTGIAWILGTYVAVVLYRHYVVFGPERKRLRRQMEQWSKRSE